MPLYMDTHSHIEGLTADGVAQAHAADLKTQEKYGVKYLRYWFDEDAGKVFCLNLPRSKRERRRLGVTEQGAGRGNSAFP
jgi:hypothetical protein